MRCSNCGSDNSEGLKFCNQCGVALNAHCPQCGFDNASKARFCGQCGASLTAGTQVRTAIGQAERPENRPQLRTGERRHLTVLFCDLVGSTEIAARLDPEEWQETVAAYHRAAADAIGRFGGYVAKYLGDGVMAYFGYPEAHDNDAECAARAGLAIIDTLSKLNDQPDYFPLKEGGPERGLRPKLSARVGIDSGAVVVGAGAGTETDVFGEAPNIAARVQGAAAPGTVLISGATHRLVAGLFVVEDCGRQALKGVERPMQLYRVIRPAGVRGRLAAAAASRGLTPFVGREDELRMLASRWQRVVDGEGQAVTIIGEAGIGKSRLVQQFHQQIAGTPHTWVEAAAAPFYQNTPFYPVAEALWQLVWEQSLNRFGDYLRELQMEGERDGANAPTAPPPSPSPVSKNGGGDRNTLPRAAGSPPPLFDMREGQGGGADAKLTELQSGLISAGLTPAEAIPLIAPLLHVPLSAKYAPSSLSPEQQRRRLLATLIEWLLGAARAQPLVIVIEDLHWADPSTLELIQLLLEQETTARMLLLYTARPEFHAEWPLRAHHTQITLNRLSARNVREMIAQVAARSEVASETVDAVVERTSGVPLFVEELTRAVLENGNTRLLGHEVPVTLHDSLMARLDRLGSAKEVLQIGSVIGSEFSYELLQAVHPSGDEELQQALNALTNAELLYVRGIAPDATYQFKHALIRDAAYEALLKTRRRELHRNIAEALVGRFVGTAANEPELVAHHYTAAGLGEHAVAYWQKAGERAVDRSAYLEAISHLSKGLDLLKTLPETTEHVYQELNLQTILGAAFMATKSYADPEVGRAFTRARALCSQMGETKQLAQVLYGLWVFNLVRAELPTAYEAAERLLQLGEITQDPVVIMEGHHGLGQILYFMGEFTAAREHLEQAIALYDSQRSSSCTIRPVQDPRVMCRGYTGMSLWHLGYPDQALKRVHEAFTLAEELRHPFSFVFAQNFRRELYQFRKQGQLAQEQTEAMAAFSTDHGFPLFVAIGTFMRGAELVAKGQIDQGLIQMRQGMDSYLAGGTELGHETFLSGLAAALGAQGQIDEALALLTEALAFVNQTGQRRSEARVYLLKGALLLRATGHDQEAEESFRHALYVARRQQAKSLELEAVLNLSRLWQQQHKKEEAHAMLAEIYNWFTEGFDTPDLMDAKALLDSLVN